jgi:hypothetical protein
MAAREKELADRERELAERELTAKEQNEKLKQQNLMLTEKLKEQAVAEPTAGASGRRPAGKTLPANYPRAEVARAVPVESQPAPVAKPAVQFLNFMPKGSKGAKAAPTRVSPGGPFSSTAPARSAVPLSALKPVKTTTVEPKSRVSKKEKERDHARKAAKSKAKFNDIRAEDILARDPVEVRSNLFGVLLAQCSNNSVADHGIGLF